MRPRGARRGVRLDSRMRARALTATLAAAALVLAGGAPAADGAQRPSRAVKKSRLVTFDSCRDLVGYARRYAPTGSQASYAPGGGFAFDTITAPLARRPRGRRRHRRSPQRRSRPPTTGPAATPRRPTCRSRASTSPTPSSPTRGTIFAIANGDLHAVDARTAQPQLLGTLELDGQGEQLLVHGDRLLVIGTTYVGEGAGARATSRRRSPTTPTARSRS